MVEKPFFLENQMTSQSGSCKSLSLLKRLVNVNQRLSFWANAEKSFQNGRGKNAVNHLFDEVGNKDNKMSNSARFISFWHT